MSWNNVIPAWLLFPVRVTGRYANGGIAQAGFNTMNEAEDWALNEENLVEYEILMD